MSANEKHDNKEQDLDFKIQITDLPLGAVTPEMSVDAFIEATKGVMEDVARVVRATTESFFEHVKQLDARPSECAIEFGVNVGGEAGVPFVTKGTVGANFKVTLRWQWSDRK